MIVLCHSLLKKELSLIARDQEIRKQMRKAVEKIRGGLGTHLKGVDFPASRLVKTPFTSRRGAGRILFLILIKKDYYVPLLLRFKNDKEIGENMSWENFSFRRILRSHLDLAENDIAKDAFTSINP